MPVTGFFDLPAASRYTLRRVYVPASVLGGPLRGPVDAAVTGPDRASRWHAVDVRCRLEFGLQTAYAKGVVAVRTHLDLLAPQPATTFPVFRKLHDEWADKIELQPSTICPIDIFLTEQGRELAEGWPISAATWAAVRASWRRCRRWCRRSSTSRWSASSRWRRSAASTSTCMSTNRAMSKRAR